MVDMVRERACQAVKGDGKHCEAAPLSGEDHCFWHSPKHAEGVAEAGRLGGLGRRRRLEARRAEMVPAAELAELLAEEYEGWAPGDLKGGDDGEEPTVTDAA